MTASRYAIGMPMWEIDTPALVVDIELVKQNLARMAAVALRYRKSLRPHVKTHKTPLLAHLQLDAGAIGVAAAKLSEAEAMVAGGIREVLITTEIVGATKIERLLALSRYAHIIGVVDDAAVATDLSSAFEHHGQRFDVLVDVNVGQNRTGVEPGEPTVALARHVATLPGLRLRGLQAYEGHLQHIYAEQERADASRAAMRLLTDTVRIARAAGLTVDIVSTAGTGTHSFAAQVDEVTELQPGSYVLMDSDYSRVAGVEFANALTILTTVISRVRPRRAVVDAGWKAASTDAGPPSVIGVAEAIYTPGGDEHGILELGSSDAKLGVGDKVQLLPSHCDTTVNLYDQMHVVRAGRLEAIWKIAGRGATQ